MKKTTLITLVVIIITVGLGVYFFTQKDNPAEDMAMMKKETSTNKNEKTVNLAQTAEASRYVVYTSSDKFAKNADKKRVLFFYANWCPTCIPADANFKENASKIPQDVIVLRVNYNDPETNSKDKALAKKYGITYQHTFVQVDANDNEVTKWNGGQIEELLANIK